MSEDQNGTIKDASDAMKALAKTAWENCEPTLRNRFIRKVVDMATLAEAAAMATDTEHNLLHALRKFGDLSAPARKPTT